MISQLLTKHIGLKDFNEYEEPFKCALCGFESNEGDLQKHVLSSNFTDLEAIKYNSGKICKHCIACLSSKGLMDRRTKTGKVGLALRIHSYIVSNEGFRTFQRNELIDVMDSLPDEPFALIFSFLQKKHIFYKAALNYSREDFIVSTEDGQIQINRKEFLHLYSLCTELYHNGFVRDEIQTGKANISKITKFGMRYFEIEEELKEHRGTLLFKLIINSLKKKEKENEGKSK